MKVKACNYLHVFVFNSNICLLCEQILNFDISNSILIKIGAILQKFRYLQLFVYLKQLGVSYWCERLHGYMFIRNSELLTST